MQRKRAKGFTLMELIVVLAIIGILAGVLGPTMAGYYNKSRIKTQNSNAEIVYNAAQTIVQEYKFRERVLTDADEIAVSGEIILYCENGDITSVVRDGVAVTLDTANLSDAYETKAYPSGKTQTEKKAFEDMSVDLWRTVAYQEICDEIGEIYSEWENTSWCLYINDYMLCAVAVSKSPTDKFVGTYPFYDYEKKAEYVSVLATAADTDPDSLQSRYADWYAGL